jgi:peptidoglycan/LPS O-acetylase OafA/YrhL
MRHGHHPIGRSEAGDRSQIFVNGVQPRSRSFCLCPHCPPNTGPYSVGTHFVRNRYALVLFGGVGFEHQFERRIAILSWPLRNLGKRSYETYLFHGTILLLLVNYLKKLDFDLVQYSPVFLPLFVLICAVTAELVSKCWSEPANKFVRRLSSVATAFQPRMV